MFPAWAGVILMRLQGHSFGVYVPRVGGGDPYHLLDYYAAS